MTKNHSKTENCLQFPKSAEDLLWNRLIDLLKNDHRMKGFVIKNDTLETAKAHHCEVSHPGGILGVISDRMSPGKVAVCVSAGEMADSCTLLVTVLHDLLTQLKCEQVDISIVDQEDALNLVS